MISSAVLFSRHDDNFWFLLALAIVPLSLLAAGVMVWRKKRLGLTLSLILQGMATIDLKTRWIDWSFYFNAPGFIHLDLNVDIKLDQILRSLGVNNPPSPLVIGVDVLSAIIFFTLWKMRREQLNIEVIAESDKPYEEAVAKNREKISKMDDPNPLKLKSPWRWLRRIHRQSPVAASLALHFLIVFFGLISLSLVIFISAGISIELEKVQGAWWVVAFVAAITIVFIALTLLSYRQKNRLRSFVRVLPSENTRIADTTDVNRP